MVTVLVINKKLCHAAINVRLLQVMLTNGVLAKTIVILI